MNPFYPKAGLDATTQRNNGKSVPCIGFSIRRIAGNHDFSAHSRRFSLTRGLRQDISGIRRHRYSVMRPQFHTL